ncbi:MAG: hypothetical protein JW723_15335 [Bacteroidales bacterium]|nr:hypothetical protein [Bacteroidales bacterium]
MKIEKNILAFLLLSLIFFAGCKKDDNGSSPNNYIKYDDKTYAIDKGILENYGEWEGVYNLDLSLVSNGINLIESQGEITGATGTGNIIYFEMYTTNSLQLDNGTYEYDYYGLEAGTFDDGWVAINYDVNEENGDVEQDIEDGTVTVSRNGDIYEITIDCTDEVGKSVTGFFRGTLKWYDSSMKKSTKSGKRKF